MGSGSNQHSHSPLLYGAFQLTPLHFQTPLLGFWPRGSARVHPEMCNRWFSRRRQWSLLSLFAFPFCISLTLTQTHNSDPVIWLRLQTLWQRKKPRKPLCPLLLVWWCLHYVFAQCVSLLMKLKFSLFLLHPAPCFQKNSKTSWRKISLFHFSVLSIRIGLLTRGSKNTYGSLAFPLSPSGQRSSVGGLCICVYSTRKL